MLCDCVKDLSPGKPIFFFSNANAHALSSRRSRWRGRSAGATQCCFQIINILDVNIE